MKICNLSDITSEDSAHNKGVLHKSDQRSIVVLNVPEGREIPEHTSDKDAYLQVVSGEIYFWLKEEKNYLKEGDLFFFGAGEKHSLMGVKDAKLLLIK